MRLSGRSNLLHIYKMPLDDYVFEKNINSGGIGRVYKCRDIDTNERRAMKLVDLTVYGEKWWQKEVQMLMKFQYVRGVIKMYEFGQYVDNESEHLMGYIAMELAGSDLKDKPVAEHERDKLQRFLIRTLYEIHQNGYVLCDLKLENIVRFHDGFRICDLATTQPINERTKQVVGTDHIMAPEIISAIRGKKEIVYTEKVDVWCLGCILFEIYARVPPFDNIKVNDEPEKLYKNILYLKPNIQLIGDKKVGKIIANMLEKDPLRRPTIMEVVKML